MYHAVTEESRLQREGQLCTSGEVCDVPSCPSELKVVLRRLCWETPDVYKQPTLPPGTALILVTRRSFEYKVNSLSTYKLTLFKEGCMILLGATSVRVREPPERHHQSSSVFLWLHQFLGSPVLHSPDRAEDLLIPSQGGGMKKAFSGEGKVDTQFLILIQTGRGLLLPLGLSLIYSLFPIY